MVYFVWLCPMGPHMFFFYICSLLSPLRYIPVSMWLSGHVVLLPTTVSLKASSNKEILQIPTHPSSKVSLDMFENVVIVKENYVNA